MNAALKLPLWEEEVPEGFEMSEGRLVEMKMSFESEWIASKLVTAVNIFLDANPIGMAATNPAFRCFPRSRRTVRKPDLAFLRNGRVPDDLPPRSDPRIPPDLAVEIVSPNDESFELEQKIVDYFSVGVELVWIVYPHTRTAVVFRLDGTAARLSEQQDLDGEGVIPGFRCRLGSILPRLRPAPSPEPEATDSGTV